MPAVYQHVFVPPNTSLADLNTMVAQTEVAGPLVQMGNDGKQTVLSFDFGQVGPTIPAVIQATSAPPPANTDKVCDGGVFVAGTLTDSTAYRPKTA